MDPKTQECLGFYLYGAGYFARDDNTLSLISANPRETPPHFCLSCPKLAECEDEHEQRVRRVAQAACETFDRMMKKGLKQGHGATLVAAFLGSRGLDPFAKFAVENFARGHADRGRKDGLLVK